MGLWADRLVDVRLLRPRVWPPPADEAVWRELALWIAFRDNDAGYLSDHVSHDPIEAGQYRIDPLAGAISGAYRNLIFGQAPKVTTANEADQERMDELIRLNRFGSALKREAVTSSSEGEVWWRWVSLPDRYEAPVLSWHSRTTVIPLFSNGWLRAAAFYSELDMLDTDSSGIYRHFEIHEHGEVTHWLFRGAENSIGERVDLAAHPDTVTFVDQWVHGLDMLAGRILNEEGPDYTLGISDYDAIQWLLLELNDILITGAKNRALTAQQRAIVPPEALTKEGDLPRGNVISAEMIDAQWGEAGAGRASAFGLIEWKFDAQALIEWQNQTAVLALSRKGITPQFVGAPAGAEGYAATGTALRIRLLPAINEGENKAGKWDDELDGILLLGQQLDAMPQEQSGFGTVWAEPGTPPSVERGPSLQEDPMEQATRQSLLATAHLLSREAAIRERHPDWDETQIQDELDQIDKDAASEMPAAFGATLPRSGARAAGDASATASDQGAESATVQGPKGEAS